MRVNIQALSMAVLPMCNSGGNEGYRCSGFRMPQTPINARRSSPYGDPSYVPDSHKRTTLKSIRRSEQSEPRGVWPSKEGHTKVGVSGLAPRKKVIRRHQRSERARPPVGLRMTFFPAVRSTFSNGSSSNTTISGHTKT